MSVTGCALEHAHCGISGGHIHACANCLNMYLTGRSSSEWKLMTATLPPGRTISTALFTPEEIRFSS